MRWKVSTGLGLILVLLASSQYACSRAPAGHTTEPISLTKWTTKTELFVEFTPLVVGKETPFAAHLTDLGTFQPVSRDVLITTLERQDGRTITVRTEEPTSPGIYRPVAAPAEPGSYRLVFERLHPETQAVLDTIEAGEVVVVEDAKDLPISEGEPAVEGITFLKEQQWQIDFATEQVTPRELLASLQVQAEVKPAAGGEVHITAPLSGRVLAVEQGVPTLGQLVEPGEPLAFILPLPTKSRAELDYAVSATRSELKAAEQELARVQDLYADRIVPKRRLEQAQKDVTVLEARLSATRAQLSLFDVNPAHATTAFPSGLERFLLRAPIAGTVVSVNMTPGALIEAGHDLFTIMNLERVWIEGRVFEADIPKVRHVEHARFVAPALPAPLLLSPPDARLVTIGSVLDPANRSVPLILAVNNARGQLKIGMHGQLAVPTGEIVRDIAIPVSAIIHDKGIPVAFVQVGGETFAQRELEVGIQSNDAMQVKAGLTAGERVVTKGAYRVHLASLSSELPEHGHAH